MQSPGNTCLMPADVLSAQKIVQHHVWHTPLVRSQALDALTGGEVYLKPECWQPTGSFKVRGAVRKLADLSPDELARGVVTASAGNHGLGVAYASQVLRLPPPVVFVPENTPESKLQRLAGFGCQVCRAGANYDSTQPVAKAYAREHNAVYVSAHDDPVVVAGQGTAGLEAMRDLPDADLLLVPVGGGALIAGTALVAKAINPGTLVVGLQPEASPAAYLSLRDGSPYDTYPAEPTICDGLAGGFGRVPFDLAADLIDEIVVVPESAIRQAVAWLLTREQMLVEGSGAIAIAPLLTGQVDADGKKTVPLLTGRNLDTKLLQEILKEHTIS
ncbi:threonine/serine dehydratase [Chloroflexota bacterium]